MFAIIIVNLNGEKYLQNCFQSLLKQTYCNFKVYFVDNASVDNSVRLVESFRDRLDIELIKLDKNYGFAVPNNIAIERAMKHNCQYIITLNNDTELDKNCLDNLKNEIEKKKGYDVFQILMLNYFKRDIIDAAGIKFDQIFHPTPLGYMQHILTLEQIGMDIQGVCAGAAVYSRNALEAVVDDNGNFFDPIFFAYYEDVDLSFRLLKKGYKFALVKESIVYHMHSGTAIHSSPFKTYYLTRNLLLCLAKNLDDRIYKKNRPIYFYLLFKSMMKYLLRKDYGNFLAAYNGLKDYFLISRSSNFKGKE